METKTEPAIKGNSTNNHASELKALSTKLTTANSEIQNLGRSEEMKKIVEMIKRHPGWTTPAELAFANSLANTVISNVKTLQNTIQEFTRAASLVKEF